jgi:nucleotide-binding universal stress UspA family protein
MFKKTLVLLDGSKLAEEIIPYITDACSRPDSEVVLLQVNTSHITIAPPQSIHTLTYGRETKPGTTSASDMSEHFIPESGAGSELKEIEREQSKSKGYLEDVADRLRAQGMKVKTVTLEGDVNETIVNHIQNSHVSVVALTTHGASGMDRGLLGSVAQYVMKESPVPVLLVKTRGKAVKKEEQY